MTGKAGGFTVLEYAARIFDIAQGGVISRFADGRIRVHERMAFTVEAFIARADRDRLRR